jgi:hypothetical protein
VFPFKYPGAITKNKVNFLRGLTFFGLFATIALFQGCDSEDKPAVRPDQEYIPLVRGWYQTYDVEEIIYELGVPETLRYQLKTVVADSFPGADGTITYVVHQSIKPEGSDEWLPDGTFSSRLTTTEAITTVGSTPYVVLVFPARKGIQWDGNAYNDESNPGTNDGQDIYTIDGVGERFETGSLSFDDCVKILQEDNAEFFIYHDERREVYARNTGLVFKETIQLHYCSDEDRNCIGKQIVDEGKIYRQTITGYGRE